LSKGKLSVRVVKRAMALLALDEGQSLVKTAAQLQVSDDSVAQWRNRYQAKGLEAALYDQPRSGRPIEIDGLERAKITALATSTPPDGYGQWSLRLLADKVVELGYDEAISHTTVGQILKKNELQPHLKKQWCLGQLDGAFMARMEKVLHLYALPYDPDYPVICFDERPCFLIGEVRPPELMKPGAVKKEHYEYEKNGSAVVLSAIEPLTGKRLSRVFAQRRKTEYAQFMQELAQSYPQAKKIRLVQDNLNTHNDSSFYPEFLAEEAFALAQRFEFYYTPKSGSWLNMIELEFSALSKQCLNRRIPTLEELQKEVLAWTADRNQKAIKIQWQFSIQKARVKLNRHYQKVNSQNSKYRET